MGGGQYPRYEFLHSAAKDASVSSYQNWQSILSGRKLLVFFDDLEFMVSRRLMSWGNAVSVSQLSMHFSAYTSTSRVTCQKRACKSLPFLQDEATEKSEKDIPEFVALLSAYVEDVFAGF